MYLILEQRQTPKHVHVHIHCTYYRPARHTVDGKEEDYGHSKTGGHGQAENCLVNVHNQEVSRIVHSKLQAWKLFWK